MATVGFWLAQLWQPFKWTADQPQAHSGIDKGMPCGSVVEAPVSGQVLNASPKPWGGQVDVLVPAGSLGNGYDQSSPYVLSFLHLSREDVKPGDTVYAGQQLGLSGQPPPGAGFGSGCHLHFEVTHGSTPPYQGTYSPWHPTATSYPVNGQPLLDNLTANGLSLAGASLAGAVGTGTVAGTGTAAGSITGAVVPTLGDILSNPLASIAQEFSSVGAVIQAALPWIADPIRVAKLVVGIMLVLGALIVTFLPDLGAAAVTAAGVPEAAPLVRGALAGSRGPRGITKSAIGTAGAVQGRKTLAKRELRGRLAAHEAEHKQRQEWGRAGAAAAKAAKRRKAEGKAGEKLPPAFTAGTPEYAARQQRLKDIDEQMKGLR